MGLLRNILGLDDKPKSAMRSASAEATAEEITAPQESISEALRPFRTFIEGMLDNLVMERMDELTLREAITRFVEGKPKQFEPAKGALIVQSHREGKLVFWAFLNRENNLMCDENGKPFGRKAICNRLDFELTATLKGNELLIFE